MADITMCKDEECPFKEKCYRFMAEPSKFQSYFNVKWNGIDCKYYLGMGN